MPINEKSQLLVEPATYAIEEYSPPPEIFDNELTVDDACPDCDSLLDKFYDAVGKPKYICDNCGMLIKGNILLSADMDIA